MRKRPSLLITLVLAASAAAPAGAAAPPARQATFSLSASDSTGASLLRGVPGDDLAGALSVSNLANRPVTIQLQPADIRNATNGNADYITSKLSGAGRWLRLETTAVRLAPGATERVPYTVGVPPTASGASHYAGIVGVDTADLASEPPKAKDGDKPSFSFERINRLAMPITIRLPGPREHDLALRSVGIEAVPAGAGLILGLLPEGTELIPATEIDLEVTRGKQVILEHEATLGQLFPGDLLDYRIPWEGRPTEGEYRVVGELRPEGAPAVAIDRTVTFSSDVADELEEQTTPGATAPGLPLWILVALACAGALALASVVAVLRMKRRLAAAAPSG